MFLVKISPCNLSCCCIFANMGVTIFFTADFDLTGQLVWPGAMILNDYLSSNADLLRGCSVIELGSGVGKCHI